MRERRKGRPVTDNDEQRLTIAERRQQRTLPEPPRPDGKGERTRQRILDAARRCFGRVGFERATIRMIAAEADADKSSVIQYFGTKHNLFRESVYFDIPIQDATTSDIDSTVENYLRGMLARWELAPDSPEAVLTRTAMTSEDAAELLRRHITNLSVDPIADNLADPDARLRAALFSMMMMGIATGRFVLHLPDLAGVSVDDLVRVARPALSRVLEPQDPA